LSIYKGLEKWYG